MKKTALPQSIPVSTLDEFVHCIDRSKNIIVIAGAGISVSCGIPDFRSKVTGLYNSLDCTKMGIPSPELLFDLDFFKIDPVPFYKFASSLLPNEHILPSASHNFIALLERKQKLLRVYTQNVDGLERRAGIDNVIECHGTMTEFQCMTCKKKIKLNSDLTKTVSLGEVCYCIFCKWGVLKPCITFFGENVSMLFERAVKRDAKLCDLVIVIGTSLKVGGSVQELLKKINVNASKVLVNRDIVTKESAAFEVHFDLSVLGDCDSIVQYLCRKLLWTLDDKNKNLVCVSSPAACPDVQDFREAKYQLALASRVITQYCELLQRASNPDIDVHHHSSSDYLDYNFDTILGLGHDFTAECLQLCEIMSGRVLALFLPEAEGDESFLSEEQGEGDGEDKVVAKATSSDVVTDSGELLGEEWDCELVDERVCRITKRRADGDASEDEGLVESAACSETKVQKNCHSKSRKRSKSRAARRQGGDVVGKGRQKQNKRKPRK